MTISLTEREIGLVVSACIQYVELMSQGEDTHDYTNYELETGLGSALRKLSKGRYGERLFGKYKTVTKYPTFNQWKARLRDETLRHCIESTVYASVLDIFD